MALLPGEVFKNDESISDDTRLLRRIPPDKIKRSVNPPLPDSDNLAISPDGTGTSVDIWENDEDPAKCLEGHEGFGLVYLTAKQLRDKGLGIIHDPLPQKPNHALIQGPRSRGTKRWLAKNSVWVHLPE